MKKIIYLFLAGSLCCGMWSCNKDEIADGNGGNTIPKEMEKAFPDPIFRKYVLEKFDKDNDGKISKEEALKVTDISFSSKGIKSLDGVQYFTNLETLYCGESSLTSLDVSKNTKLTDLYCGENQLTSLDVSKNTKLTDLYCGDNQLTSLDVSKNTALTQLDCYFNQLTSLDVSKNTKLTYLDCADNKLTSLDVSQNTALTDLWCTSNPLTTIYMKQGQTIADLSKPSSAEIVYVN